MQNLSLAIIDLAHKCQKMLDTEMENLSDTVYGKFVGIRPGGGPS